MDSDDAVSPGAAAADKRAAAPGRLSARTRTLLLCIGVGALLVGAAWGAHWWTVGRFIESTDDAYLQADSVTVAPKISGYVAEVYVADNQSVPAGAALVRLDARPYQASLTQLTATAAARQADIARGQADLSLQRANIDQARAQLRGARSNATYALAQVRRYEPLVASGAETGERLAELRNAQDQAAATVQADEAALEAAQRQLGATQAQIQQARAQLEAAVASAESARLDTEDTIVKSSVAGRVGDRTVRVGQYVQPGTRLMTIVPVQDIYLEANFKETQIGLMRPGQPASIHVDALSGSDLHGTVSSFAPGTGSEFALLPPQNATGNFTKIVQRVPVRIHVDAGEEARKVLVPGLSVTVTVDTRSGRDAPKRIASESNHG
ncbi:MAG TPA: HlyD family secretion protein [Steroidobacteraceae bacterium]|nr:HlyD family secretion protein [Steroidobacteraceae bacterium]